MTTTIELSKYTDEVQSIASYAKRTKFNFDSGDFSEMIKGWYKERVLESQFLADKDNWFTIRGILEHRCGLK